ncbi:MAG: hypothetical protein GY803_06480, partial [Chloroflexi bacterium]|nr:hypothetical protein [Chloroflexota bacterium]
VLTGGAALLPAAILLGAAGGGVSGVVGQAVQDLAAGQVSGWETYALQFGVGALGGAVAGVVSAGGAALSAPLWLSGAAAGLSAGALSGAAANLATGRPWHEGVFQMTAVGALGGAAGGAVLGRLSPNAGLWTKMAASGGAGATISGGSQVAINVATGRPWDEGLGTAVAVGLATGIAEAGVEHYGDGYLTRRNLADGNSLNKAIYDKLAETSMGEYILKHVDQIGKRPEIVFSDDLESIGRYLPEDNKILLNSDLKSLPMEAAISVAAHELTHRIGRKLTNSRATEVQTHFVEAQVWRELNGAEIAKTWDLSGLSDVQRKYLESAEQISQIRTVKAMEEYVKDNYGPKGLDDYSVTYIEEYNQRIQRYEQQIALIKSSNWEPEVIAQSVEKIEVKMRETRKELNLSFWESFSE